MRNYVVTSVVSIQLVVTANDEDDAEDLAGREISKILEQHDVAYEFDRSPIIVVDEE